MVIEHRMANQNVGRDELAALLGASHASDMVAAAGTTATDLTKKSLTSGAAGGAGRAKHYTKGGEIDDDISKMDRAQAAALVARKFAGGEPSSSVGGGVARHRATGKRKRMLQHHLLVGDLMEQQQQQQAGDTSGMEQEEDVAKLYQKSEENDDDGIMPTTPSILCSVGCGAGSGPYFCTSVANITSSLPLYLARVLSISFIFSGLYVL